MPSVEACGEHVCHGVSGIPVDEVVEWSFELSPLPSCRKDVKVEELADDRPIFILHLMLGMRCSAGLRYGPLGRVLLARDLRSTLV